MKKLQAGVPFVGVTRFSVFTPKNSLLNTSLRHNSDLDSYLRELYSTERMTDRLQIFGEVAAPVYQEFSESNDYTHLLQYSAEMPDAYKQQIFEIAEKFPAIKPILVTDETMDQSVRKYIKTWDPAFCGVFVWLRVDDDDVLSIDYLDALRKYAVISNVGSAVSFSTVMVAQYAKGEFLNFRQARLPKNSIGQAYIGYANVSSGVVDVPAQLPHNRIDEFLPLILDPRGIRALQVRHAWQDTSNVESLIGHRIAHRSFELGELPNVNLTHVREKFPYLPKSGGNNDNAPQTSLTLSVGEWVDVEEAFNNFQSGVIVRFSWSTMFAGKPNDGSSLSIEFDDNEKADGHFPKDAARGNYRRLHVNAAGRGANFLVFPSGAKPLKMRLNADSGEKNALKTTIEFVQIASY